MGDKSKIAWTDATWNPVSGCTKVSAGCKFCYAERTWPRLNAPGQPYEGRAFIDVQCHPERLDQPLRWKKPRRIFVNSMSDLFHEDVPDDFISEVFAVMALSGKHTFQVLTKRPDRMKAFMADPMNAVMVEGMAQRRYYESTGDDPSMWMAVNFPIENVWLGVSIEDQDTVRRILPLLSTPAAIRWVSVEPLIEKINLTSPVSFLAQLPERKNINWIVVGGESGHKARPMDPGWARSIRDDCKTNNVPFFMKQLSQNGNPGFKVFANFPEDLQIREYPGEN